MEDLEKYIKNSINYALDTSVKDGIVKEFITQAQNDVYDAYNPRLYNRRESLLQEENYLVEKPGDMKLSVTPVAKFKSATLRYNKKSHSLYPSISTNGNGDELAGLINYGDGWNGYNYEFVIEDAPYTEPRPFIDDTRDVLDEGLLEYYLIEGMSEMGLKFK